MLSSRFAVSTPSRSRCFRTDSAGRITLNRDWPALFRTLRALPAIALQSRHTYARLIHLGPVPELTWDEAGTCARDGAGDLQFRCDRWGAAWARLAICACCDSPGHVEILNHRGGDILQLCATEHISPATWAGRLEQLASAEEVEVPTSPQIGFPLVPSLAHDLRETADLLPVLLNGLGDQGVPVRFIVRTPEVLHQREFIPQRVSLGYPLLTAADRSTTLQLALPPVQRLALAPDCTLFLAGPGNTVLLALAGGSDFRPAWQAAVHACFPSARELLSSS